MDQVNIGGMMGSGSGGASGGSWDGFFKFADDGLRMYFKFVIIFICIFAAIVILALVLNKTNPPQTAIPNNNITPVTNKNTMLQPVLKKKYW